ncbi:MAG: hypothetical protein ABI419_10090 [Ginsengibacter sp.]
MKYYIFLFFLLSSSQCFSQKVIVHASIVNKKTNAASDTIYYTFNRQLTWSDFKGKPDENHFGGAVTASGFAFDSKMNFDGKNIYLDIEVYTFFSKKDSWKKPQINSAYHLLHEQHHFDITRMSAEKLANDLAKANFTKDNYNSLLNALFEKAYKENSELQRRYDKETSHSIDTTKQQEWNDKIAVEIKKLKETAIVKN